MNKIFLFTTILALSVIMTGCLKEEAPVTLEPRNPNSTYKQFNCTPESNIVTFFDLNTGNSYTANNNTWHLALDARNEGNSIRTNLTESSSKLYNTRKKDFYLDYSNSMIESNLTMDSSNSMFARNAVSLNGFAESNVFIYHQEPNIAGSNELKIQFQLLSANSTSYYLQYKDLLDTACAIHILRIIKNSNFNFMYLSFKNGGNLVKVEPKKDKWDLMFTQYREMVKYEVDLKLYPYQVMGVLINPYRTHIYKLTKTKEYAVINSDDCKLAVWTNTSNEVGYNWKEYSINNSLYTVDKSKNWLLKDQNEEYFKFRFINYYNTNGESGYPTLEFGKF